MVQKMDLFGAFFFVVEKEVKTSFLYLPIYFYEI